MSLILKCVFENEFFFRQIEITYDIERAEYLLKPTSFTLAIKRNLSYSWFKDQPQIEISGRLKSIELNLVSHDYLTIMQILELNMTEGLDEFKKHKSFKSPEQVKGMKKKLTFFLYF